MPTQREVSEVNSLAVEQSNDGQPKSVFYFLHCRPALLTGTSNTSISSDSRENKTSFTPNGVDIALSLETSAGGVKAGENENTAAQRELKEEMGITPEQYIKLSPNITHDPGAFISRVSRYIMNIGNSPNISPEKADPTQVAIIKVPIQDAMTYLYQQAQKGINVSAQSVLTTLETLSHYGINPSTKGEKKDIKAELTWSAFQDKEKQNNQPLSFVQKLFKSLAEKFPQSTGDFSLKFLQASS
ncbi:MAG: NUDIX domain-containing protein [Candidatus Melainabacteria bacterium]|nr:NUDIX domain-containing protein [Candidatus Melainabacteria bacterium]